MQRREFLLAGGRAALGFGALSLSACSSRTPNAPKDAFLCFTAGSTERRSGLMVMLNGDTYVPFGLKLQADPSGPAPDLSTIWPEFMKRFFAA